MSSFIALSGYEDGIGKNYSRSTVRRRPHHALNLSRFGRVPRGGEPLIKPDTTSRPVYRSSPKLRA